MTSRLRKFWGKGSAALAVGLGVLAPTAVRAQGPAASDTAKLQAEIARLDKELREQKQLILQVMQADQQRYETLFQLIRSMQGGAPATPLPPAPTGTRGEAAAPGGSALGNLAGAAGNTGASSGSTTGTQATALVSGKVQLPAGAQEAYVYVDGRGSPRPKQLEIRQEGKQFTPPVSVVPVGSRVTFPNADTVFHNVFSRTPGTVFDLGTVKGGESSPPVTLVTPGHVEIFCNIHSKMRADVLVVPNTLYTKVRADGTFALASVPVGSRKLVVWGPGLKAVAQTVEVRNGVTVKFAPESAPTRPHMKKDGKAYPSYE
jgi:plastocyanin